MYCYARTQALTSASFLFRGLLKGCAEVSLNLLAPGEAADLLLGTAQIKDADAAALAAAEEIAVLCGNLPLFISICGGVIAGYEDDPSWKTEVVGMLVEDRVGLIEDSTGDRTVERLVDSSLSMLKDQQTTLVFMALGVCPEDVLVELPVAQLVCGADVDVAATGKLSSMSMRRIVKTLLDRHLLQGSVASGVQMHDIVRDLVRSRLGGDDGIRAKQRAVVAAFVAACSADDWAVEGTVGQYATAVLEQHMAEALLSDPLADASAHAWLSHPNQLVVRSAATVMGSKALDMLSTAKEAAGDLAGAARIAWAAYSVCQLGAVQNELLYRAAALLETESAGSTVSVSQFETDVLELLMLRSLQCEESERHSKAMERYDALLKASGTVTVEALLQQYFAEMPVALGLWQNFCKPVPCPWEDVCNGTSYWRQAIIDCCRGCQELGVLPAQVCAGRIICTLIAVFTGVTCHMPNWEGTFAGEASLIGALEHFQAHPEDGAANKHSGINCALICDAAVVLGLYYGNVPQVSQWARGSIAAYRLLDVSTTKDYKSVALELHHTRIILPIMVLHFGLAAEAQALLGAFGYGWSDSGFANYDLWLQAFSELLPNFNLPGEVVYHRLLVYLVLPKTAGLDAEFSSWVASPAELAQIEHDSPWNFDFAYQGILHVAAEAFLRAGRDDDAAEAARIAVSPDHQTREHVTLAAALCPDSKRGEDQLPALLVPAERGKALFIKERYLAGDMGVKNVRTSRVQKHSSVQAYK